MEYVTFYQSNKPFDIVHVLKSVCSVPSSMSRVSAIIARILAVPSSSYAEKDGGKKGEECEIEERKRT